MHRVFEVSLTCHVLTLHAIRPAKLFTAFWRHVHSSIAPMLRCMVLSSISKKFCFFSPLFVSCFIILVVLLHVSFRRLYTRRHRLSGCHTRCSTNYSLRYVTITIIVNLTRLVSMRYYLEATMKCVSINRYEF